ncbi:MAG: hypothetical protein ACRYFY_19005 [Janthinobacterium lividum]
MSGSRAPVRSTLRVTPWPSPAGTTRFQAEISSRLPRRATCPFPVTATGLGGDAVVTRLRPGWIMEAGLGDAAGRAPAEAPTESTEKAPKEVLGIMTGPV